MSAESVCHKTARPRLYLDMRNVCLLLIGLMACAVDGDDDENLSQTSQAVTAMGYWWWGVTNNTTPPADLGPSSDRTCFLQGIGGEFVAAPGTTPARVKLYISYPDLHWKLEVRAGSGAGVVGYATCIPVTNNRRWMYWQANQPNATISKNSSTHCFLTQIYATTGFQNLGGAISVNKETSVWSLGGYLDATYTATPGGATAVCLDFNYVPDSYLADGETIVAAKESQAVCSMRTFAKMGLQPPAPIGSDIWKIGARLKPDSVYNTCLFGVCNWWAIASPGYTIAGDCLHPLIIIPL